MVSILKQERLSKWANAAATASGSKVIKSLAARYLEKKTRRFFYIFFAPPPLPVSPCSPEVDPMIDQHRRSG